MQMLRLIAGRLGMTFVWLLGSTFLAVVAAISILAIYLYVVADHSLWLKGLAVVFLSFVITSCGVGLLGHTAAYRKFLKIFRG